MSNLLNIHFARFVLVGVVNTAFSYSIYAGLLFVGFHYAFANFVALLLGIIFSFRMQGRFVFGNTDISLAGRFLLGWGLIYVATVLVIGWMIGLGLDAYSAGALALPFTTVFSYFVQKNFVFRLDRKNPAASRTHPVE
jgi:putative flippase GtrA